MGRLVKGIQILFMCRLFMIFFVGILICDKLFIFWLFDNSYSNVIESYGLILLFYFFYR